MKNPHDLAALEEARADVRAIATEFCRAAGPATDAALRSRLQSLVEAKAEWFEAIEPAAQSAFRVAAERAIALSVAEVERRLAEEDLWLDPLTAPGLVPATEGGWNAELPEWAIGLLRFFSRKDTGPRLGGLDDPANRAWILILAAAKPLDPRPRGVRTASFGDPEPWRWKLRPRPSERRAIGPERKPLAPVEPVPHRI